MYNVRSLKMSTNVNSTNRLEYLELNKIHIQVIYNIQYTILAM